MGRMFWVLLLAGCASATEQEPQQVCTLIGCSNGLAVEVNSSLQQSVTVNVQAGTQVIHTFRCDPGQPCRAFVENQTPEEVSVHLQTPQGTVSKTFRPEYRANRPNGPDCPPDCRQATITLAVS